jgi:TatD DNase family protein
MTDTHAHLYDCADDELSAIIAGAAAVGVDTIINTAVSIDTSRTVLNQCRRFPERLRAAIGVSPFDTANINAGWDDELRGLLLPPLSVYDGNPDRAVAAIGEIGLDCANPKYPPLDAQMPIFTRQLEIAVNIGLPVVVHSRGMEKRAAEICVDARVKSAVFHCFTGDAEALEYIVGCGYYVSISGIITYKNSHLRDLIRRVPKEKLLVETDSPYLSPAPRRGKPNQPAFLQHTVHEIAALCGVDESELLETLKNNTEAAFRNIYWCRY